MLRDCWRGNNNEIKTIFKKKENVEKNQRTFFSCHVVKENEKNFPPTYTSEEKSVRTLYKHFSAEMTSQGGKNK